MINPETLPLGDVTTERTEGEVISKPIKQFNENSKENTAQTLEGTARNTRHHNPN